MYEKILSIPQNEFDICNALSMNLDLLCLFFHHQNATTHDKRNVKCAYILM